MSVQAATRQMHSKDILALRRGSCETRGRKGRLAVTVARDAPGASSAAGNEAGEHEPTSVARRPRFFAFCTRLSRPRLDQPPAHAADSTIPDSCLNGVRDCAL